MNILVTGSEGYLMSKFIDWLEKDNAVTKIIGLDIRETSRRKPGGKYVYLKHDITQPLELVLQDVAVDTIIHAAWWFNPTHDLRAQDRLDLQGTRNVLQLAAAKKVKQLIYLGSTTAYAPIPENPNEPPFPKEEDWRKNSELRKRAVYRYSRNKAVVDEWFQKFAEENPEMAVFWIRGAIVFGPATNNIVSYVVESPFTFGIFMFRVAGYDPQMQFLSERDVTEILYRAYLEKWRGPLNAASEGTIKYSEVIKILGRRELCLPAWILYPVTEILWRLRIFKFPASLIDMIRYPWVGDISLLKSKGVITDTSEQALREFAAAKNRRV